MKAASKGAVVLTRLKERRGVLDSAITQGSELALKP